MLEWNCYIKNKQKEYQLMANTNKPYWQQLEDEWYQGAEDELYS